MQNPINNIHDKFVKEFLSDKDMAISFLDAILPQDLANELLLESLTYVNTQYITPQLEEYFSDVVVNIDLKNQQECQICFLLEHKSYIDKNVVFQVLAYIGQAYLTQLKNNEKVKPIIPLIYYHGSKKWEFKQISSFFEEYPTVFKSHLTLFESLFVNLKGMNESKIQALQNAMLRSALMLQYDSDKPEALLKNLIRILESLAPYQDSNFLTSIFVYTLQTSNIKVQELRVILKDLPTKLNNKVMSTYDMILEMGFEEGIQSGIQKGRQEGRQEGIEKGKAEIVLNAFDNHFKIADIILFSKLSEKHIIDILKENGRL
jgi:predicted transposase/invertase (TIGR01784 family)